MIAKAPSVYECLLPSLDDGHWGYIRCVIQNFFRRFVVHWHFLWKN